MVEMVELDPAAERIRVGVAAGANTSGFAPRKSTITPGHTAIDEAETRVRLKPAAHLRTFRVLPPARRVRRSICLKFPQNTPRRVSHRSQDIKSPQAELKHNVSSTLTCAWFLDRRT
jgi:hypothetical protein